MTVITPYFLTRRSSTPQGTLGELTDGQGNHVCFTCELPWDANLPDKSCVPIGTYTVIPHNSSAHPDVWELQNVPGRSGILIHNGNTEKDSLGCIIVGNILGMLNGLPAVLNSQATLDMLRETLPLNFTLTIRDT